MTKFQSVPGPFGGIDEQATTKAFEDFMGGVARAQRIFQIYVNSYPSKHPNPRYSKNKEQVFTDNATRQGFSEREIEALLEVV